MKGFKNWFIAIIIGVLLTIVVAIICIILLNKLYVKKYAEQNKQVEKYVSMAVAESTTELDTTSETTSEVHVEEVQEESSEVIYWDPNDDKDQVYFSDSSKITTKGFLPYDILGPLNMFIREKIRGFGDSSREMIIDDVTQSDKVSVIFFHTENSNYTYRYNWEDNTQELLED